MRDREMAQGPSIQPKESKRTGRWPRGPVCRPGRKQDDRGVVAFSGYTITYTYMLLYKHADSEIPVLHWLITHHNSVGCYRLGLGSPLIHCTCTGGDPAAHLYLHYSDTVVLDDAPLRILRLILVTLICSQCKMSSGSWGGHPVVQL